MRKEWSNAWASSKQPRKQRKYVHNAPLHVRHKLVSVHLAPALRERYKKRAVPVRKGDRVKVMRGEDKGYNGVVEKVELKKGVVYIENLKVKKVDGTEVPKPVKPSNLMIVELNIDDKKRHAKLLGSEAAAEKAEKKAPAKKQAAKKKEEKKEESEKKTQKKAPAKRPAKKSAERKKESKVDKK